MYFVWQPKPIDNLTPLCNHKQLTQLQAPDPHCWATPDHFKEYGKLRKREMVVSGQVLINV